MERFRIVILAALILLMGASFAFTYTQDDLFLMARVIESEAGGEPFEGQLAVATVIMNRVASPLFPDILCDVLLQEYQFARPAKTVSHSCFNAALFALNGYRALPQNVDMFQRAKTDEWYGREWHDKIGRHNFYAIE